MNRPPCHSPQSLAVRRSAVGVLPSEAWAEGVGPVGQSAPAVSRRATSLSVVAVLSGHSVSRNQGW